VAFGVTQSGLLASLKDLCGNRVISDEAGRRVYESDGLTAKRQVPWIVVLPETVIEIQQIMRLCSDAQVPVVARGAGTGLSGGAMPHSEGVLLSLAKFNKILEIDPDNLTARVEPGVTNLAISDSVRDLGLFYAPDPSSQIACTIGGNVAENSGGVHCLKYGLTVHNVKKLKMIAPNGELYEVGSTGFDSPGLDLLALLHGSEGMLGIVVEVTVQLIPIPSKIAVVLAAFASVNLAANTVNAIISQGILPAGLEMMDKLAIQAAEAFVRVGYPLDAEGLLICELDGVEEEVERQIEKLKLILEENQAMQIRVATDAAERQQLWLGRKAAFPAVGRLAPDYYCMDGTIPRSALASVLAQITQFSTKHGLAVANVFHAGDGNLHPLILYDANKPGEMARAELFGADILNLCISVGGTITGEHGVGVEKIDQMCVQFSEAELELFHGVKSAFDELKILNPGKAVPTLSRCAEFGAMHVHSSDIDLDATGSHAKKFADMERF
jgi:glycolate oxidase